MSERQLSRVVREFAQLTVADRRAVEKRLAPNERGALRRLLTQARAPLASNPPSMPGYSPWLTRHVLAVLSERPGGTTTPVVRGALRSILTHRTPLGDTPWAA